MVKVNGLLAVAALLLGAASALPRAASESQDLGDGPEGEDVGKPSAGEENPSSGGTQSPVSALPSTVAPSLAAQTPTGGPDPLYRRPPTHFLVRTSTASSIAGRYVVGGSPPILSTTKSEALKSFFTPGGGMVSSPAAGDLGVFLGGDSTASNSSTLPLEIKPGSGNNDLFELMGGAFAFKNPRLQFQACQQANGVIELRWVNSTDTFTVVEGCTRESLSYEYV